MDSADRYVISKYAIVRRTSRGLVLQTPLGKEQVVLRSEAVLKLMCALGSPVTMGELLSRIEDEGCKLQVSRFIERCYKSRLLTRVKEDERTEEESGSLAHWEFHDLLFHSQSRTGRQHQEVGATYRLKGIIPPDPCLKPSKGNETLIFLRKPKLGTLAKTERSLTAVLEARRSDYACSPISGEELGEFLFRTCRVTECQRTEDGSELVRKVYPSGGSLHSLEVYAVLNRCPELARGVYRYRGSEHALERIRDFDDKVKTIAEDASRCIGTPVRQSPAIIFVITARFRRTAWKYESIAYHLILIEVGALVQTMYLVATAMGLAACALGSGNSDLFSEITGTDYYLETSIGEFILGGKDQKASREARLSK